jgi:transposase InsO family protein
MDGSYQVNNQQLSLRKADDEMIFDKKIHSSNGHIFGIDIVSQNEHAMVVDDRKKMTIKQAHSVLGHVNRHQTIETAKKNGWIIRDLAETFSCEGCQIAKAKRLIINKESRHKSTITGERLMIDISYAQQPNGSKTGKYWLLVVDEATSMKWSFFLTNKNVQAEILLDFIKDIQAKHKKNVKYIRCDNAGENSSLETLLHKEGLGIAFEYSARSTPQQNGKVERAFATLYGRMRAMMLTAGMDLDQRTTLWVEAAATATKLSNIVVGTDHTTPHERLFNNQPAYLHHLRTFGEVGIVADKPGPTIKSKLADRGLLCVFVGYARNHAGNVYRMINMKTGRALVTRDIQWTNRYIGELKTRNIKEYLFDNAPETPTNVEAKFQAIVSEFQPEEDSHDDKKNISKVVRLKRELKAL